jgi:hypothetical protein
VITVIVWIMLYDVKHQRRSPIPVTAYNRLIPRKSPHITEHSPLYTETIKSCYPKMASTLAAEQKPNSANNKPLEAP